MKARTFGGPCARARTRPPWRRRHRRDGDGRWRRPRCRRAGPPETMSRAGSTTPSARRQSKTSPDPGDGASTSTCPPRSRRCGAMAAVAGGEGLDDEGHALRHPLGVLGRLVPVELRGAEPGAVHDLHDPLGRLVAEHPDGEDLGREPLRRCADGWGATWRGRGCEHEPDGVGPEADGQEGVGLRGDAADLHEHALRPRVPGHGVPPTDARGGCGRRGRWPGRGTRRPGRRGSRRRPAAGRRRRRRIPDSATATRPGGSPASAPGAARVHRERRAGRVWLTPTSAAPAARARRARPRRAPRPARRARATPARASEARQLVRRSGRRR